MSQENSQPNTEQVLVAFFRLAIGWTFLWAAIHHFGDDQFVTGFLSHTKTFHNVYAPLTNPAIVPTLTFLCRVRTYADRPVADLRLHGAQSVAVRVSC